MFLIFLSMLYIMDCVFFLHLFICGMVVCLYYTPQTQILMSEKKLLKSVVSFHYTGPGIKLRSSGLGAEASPCSTYVCFKNLNCVNCVLFRDR